jgi:CDP-diacylglycerol--serine O-phosphatidyltransferase
MSGKNSALLHIPLSKLIPSIITLLALCLGITSVRYALDGKWMVSAALIVAAAILDGLDGRIARLLDATSKFGAELDSLADMVSFGVAPAVITYLWSLSYIPYKGVGWSVVLFFIACSAIRLARFNSHVIEDETTSDTGKKTQDKAIKRRIFFSGVPMPAGGILLLMPMICTFELWDEASSPWFIAIYMILVAIMMASKLPTFSPKAIHVHKEYVSVVLVVAAVIMAFMILEPWIILPLFAVFYLISIPVTVWYHRQYMGQ